MINKNSLKNPLREYREPNDISRDEVMEKVGVSYQTIYFWEQGRMTPGTDNMIRLSNMMGVSFEELRKRWKQWEQFSA